MLGKSRQGFRTGGQKLNDRLVQAYPDGKLDNERPKTAQGVHPGRLVQAHSLLRDTCLVLGIATLDLL